MAHLPQFIYDLGLLLITAGITSLLFKLVKQPVVLGYILAGIAVGPHTAFFPTVADAEGIKIWSELGVIILMFSLGLEFSFKKLVNLGMSIAISAITEITLMCLTGFALGQLLGWSTMTSIFLGAIMAMSSTTIIIRALEEAGMRTQKYVSLVFGILIVEDLVAVLLMVLLSTLAVSREFAGADLLLQIAKLGFYLVAWFVIGIFLIPSLLKRFRNFLNDESLLILALALCLLMVMLAVYVGFSAALGAFIMGSILSETTQAEKIEYIIKPVKNLFAAVFFVSVGMMFDPNVLIDYTIPTLLIVVATIVGKFMYVIAGTLLAGQPLKVAVQSGMSLAQIGELSFIIAALGISLKVTDSFLYPMAVAGSIVTVLTTPFMVRQSEKQYLAIEQRMPRRWMQRLKRYGSRSLSPVVPNDWKQLIRAYTLNTIIHTVLVIVIILLSSNYLQPFISSHFNDSYNIISFSITLIAMIAPLWSLAIRKIEKDIYTRIWLNRGLWRILLIIFDILRIVIMMVLLSNAFKTFFTANTTLIAAIIAIITVIFVFSSYIQTLYNHLEKQFLSNLYERERRRTIVAPWDAHIVEFHILPESSLAGKSLSSLAIREIYGVSIAMIRRGSIKIIPPSKDDRLFPGDKISVIGEDEQLLSFKEFLESCASAEKNESDENEITLQSFTISENSFLVGQTLRDSMIRDKASALVVGIEREGQRILSPESTTAFHADDIVWIVGNKQNLQDYINNNL